ncbi:MAG: hypothetical protein Q8K61_08430 [Gallionella sp.]|nr:hypothetical protein [Gallionella sp.]
MLEGEGDDFSFTKAFAVYADEFFIILEIKALDLRVGKFFMNESGKIKIGSVAND